MSVLLVGVDVTAAESVLDAVALLELPLCVALVSIESVTDDELTVPASLDCIIVLVTGYLTTTGLVTACLFPALSVSTPVTIVVVSEYRIVATPAPPVVCAARDASLRIEEGTGFPFEEQSCWSEDMKTEGSKLDSSAWGQDLETQIRRPGRKGVEDVSVQRPVD